MAKLILDYSLGDMVVHRYYGIRQIDCVDRKLMSGIEGEYYKVKTKNGIYWFPINSLKNPRIHPMASREIILSVIEILRSVPHYLNYDPNQWRYTSYQQPYPGFKML